MSQTDERVEPKNITLYPSDWQIVQEVSTQFGLGLSAALRMIVRDWHSKAERTLVDSRVPYATEEAG